MLTFDRARELTALREGMSEAQMRDFLDLLLGGTLTAEAGGELLATLGERGETGREVAALVEGLLEHALRLPIRGGCLDLCGTGGSGLARFNVSTTAAFVLAGSGVRVAKHGNRGALRPNGSFDLLEALGVPFQLPPAALGSLLEHTGVCFLFARAMHPVVARVAAYRKAAARRTIFNLAGPLANPSRPQRQVVGVSTWAAAEVIADALTRLRVERAVVVQGEPGIDEVSVSGVTRWIEIRRQSSGVTRSEGRWRHAAAGGGSVPYDQLPGGEASENAGHFTALIEGRGEANLQLMVSVNAALALDLWHDREVFATPRTVLEAQEALSGGAARRAFELHRARARLALEGTTVPA